MERPGRCWVDLFRLFPPTAGADDVDAAVAVDVPVAEAMGESLGSGDFLARSAGAADGDALPGLGRVLAGQEVAHFPHVAFAAWRLPTHDEHFLAFAEKVDVDRRFIASAVGHRMLFPHAARGARILVPETLFARKGNDEHV